MPDDLTETEKALIGPWSRAEVDAWVARTLHELVGARPVRTVLRAGRIDAVHGLETDDGRRLILTVHRSPDAASERRAAVNAQRALARAGFPCPEPIAGPTLVDGRAVSVETMLEGGEPRTGAEPAIRRAAAGGLAAHLAILADVPGLVDEVGAPPAWCDYRGGPWPVPHDPVFDFTRTPAGYAWLDDVARRASGVLVRDLDRPGRRVVVGHGDWYCGNLAFAGDRLVGAFDWDLVADSAPVIAGLAAGGFRSDRAPTPDEIAAFLDDVEAASRAPLTMHERGLARAAALWVLAFNARCDLDNRSRGLDTGTELAALAENRTEYLELLP